jgi:hypothetical protein
MGHFGGSPAVELPNASVLLGHSRLSFGRSYGYVAPELFLVSKLVAASCS